MPQHFVAVVLDLCGGCDWQGGDYGVGKFLGGCSAAEVAGGVLALAINAFEGGFDAAGGGTLAEMIEHHDAAHQQRGGIGEAFAGDVRRGAVHGLEHSALVADISAGHHA